MSENERMNISNNIGERLHVHPLVAYMLLEMYMWRTDNLCADFSQDPNPLFARLGISPAQAMDDPSIQNLEGDEIRTCSICEKNLPRKKFFALPCGHILCINCLKDYISNYYRDHGILMIPCYANQCPQKFLIIVDELLDKHLHGSILGACPNCKCLIEKNAGSNDMICQMCHHRFCWICLKPWDLHPKDDYYHCPFKD